MLLDFTIVVLQRADTEQINAQTPPVRSVGGSLEFESKRVNYALYEIVYRIRMTLRIIPGIMSDW